jgi:hypothetical protein
MKTIQRRTLVRNVPLILGARTVLGYQANSVVRFWIIGTGGCDQYVGTLMTKIRKAQLIATCDRYADRIGAARTKIRGADKAAPYCDYRQLLDNRDVDTVPDRSTWLPVSGL